MNSELDSMNMGNLCKGADVGTLLFVRAIAHLEENGFLQKVSESKSAITGKGEAYLAESGLKLASTANILDVADRATGNAPVTDGLQVGDEGVSDASGRNPSGDENVCRVRVLGAHETTDSQNSTPLYLLASEIVGIVTKGYEQ